MATSERRSVVVIGAGVVGMAAANALLNEGFSVTVLDSGPPGEGCSFGNAGALSPGSVAPLAMPGILKQVPGYLADPEGPLYINWAYLPRAAPWLFRFVRASSPDRVQAISNALKALLSPALERYLTLLKEIGGEDLIRRTGQLHLYASDEAFAKDSRVWALRRSQGVAVENVTLPEIRQLEPAVGELYARGVFLPNEGMIANPFRLVQTLAGHFSRRGGTIRRAKVTGFEIGPEGPSAIVTDNGRVSAERIVICAGAWSHRLSAQLGSTVPLQTQRGYHVTLSDPGVSLRRVVAAADTKCFATPMEMGLRLAGTVEIDSLDRSPNYARAKALIRHGKRLLPGLKGDGGTEWMGNRPCLPDSLPVISRSPRFPSVFYGFGHGHLGLSGAAVTGDLLADLVVGRQSRIDLSPYRIDRF